MMLPEKVSITTLDQAKELLSTYTLEQVRIMWDNGAFEHPLPKEVKEYFLQRFIAGDI